MDDKSNTSLHVVEKYRELINAMNDTIWFIGFDGKFIDVNDSAVKTLGYTREELRKMGPYDIDSSLSKEQIINLMKTMPDDKVQIFETTHYTKSGKSIPVEISSSIINYGDKKAILSIARDITKRKKTEEFLKLSEERNRTILENAFDGIYLLSTEKFEYVNKQFCEITEYNSKELTSKDFSFEILLTDESKKIVTEHYNDRIKGGIKHNRYEFQLKTKSEKIKYVEVSTTNIGKANIPMILGIIRDITEQKKALKLEQEILVAKQSAEFKQKFLANMSHEIRTPLTGMLGIAEILKSTELTQKQKLYLNTLLQSGENLKEIINLVLDYSKIESGQIALKKSVFTIESLFENATTLFNSICNKKIELKTHICPNLPSYIRADQHRLNQIINNLISNAVKFTDNGYITLTAKLNEPSKIIIDKKSNNPIKIKIEVKDTGHGIDKIFQQHLFQPFSQIETGELRKYEGTGLGLSICKELTVMLGGEIGVVSKPGEGSKFWFTFVAEISDKREAQPLIANSKELSNNKALKILLVEDKKVNQMVVNLLLNSMGHDVDIVNNGQEALENYKPGFYDIILMDIQMPVMDGITATQQLKKKYKSVPPIVGLSAYGYEGAKEKYLQKGMDEYLTKPINTNDFIKIIRKLKIQKQL